MSWQMRFSLLLMSASGYFLRPKIRASRVWRWNLVSKFSGSAVTCVTALLAVDTFRSFVKSSGGIVTSAAPVTSSSSDAAVCAWSRKRPSTGRTEEATRRVDCHCGGTALGVGIDVATGSCSGALGVRRGVERDVRSRRAERSPRAVFRSIERLYSSSSSLWVSISSLRHGSTAITAQSPWVPEPLKLHLSDSPSASEVSHCLPCIFRPAFMIARHSCHKHPTKPSVKWKQCVAIRPRLERHLVVLATRLDARGHDRLELVVKPQLLLPRVELCP